MKYGQSYFYAKLHGADPDMYIIMARTSAGEGKEIVSKANQQSAFNKEVDAIHDTSKQTDE